MNTKRFLLVAIVIILFLGFLRVWSHVDIVGSRQVNTYELLGGCWQGDVRRCDLDPFE